MSSPLDCLVGSIICEIAYVHDYVQIRTDKGTMTFFNPLFLLVGKNKSKINVTSSIPRIIGKTIEYIDNCEGQYISFALSDKTKIMVSLLDENYCGPEAIVVNLDDGTVIVD